MLSVLALKDIFAELGFESATQAAKLTLDQILSDALPAHSFCLDVELVLQIANACLRIDQGSVRDLLPDECSPPGDWERENDCGHIGLATLLRLVCVTR
jgi:hypothetical protein